MKKRILTLLLALTMTLTMFTACGNTSSDKLPSKDDVIVEAGDSTTETQDTETEQQLTEKTVKLLKEQYTNGYVNFEYKYNEYGELTEKFYYSSDTHQLISYTTYEYNEYGELEKEISHRGNDHSSWLSHPSYLYKYDEQGRLIYKYESSFDEGNSYEYVVKYTYDEKNNCIKEIKYQGDCDITKDWDSLDIQSVEAIFYDYDDNNNKIFEVYMNSYNEETGEYKYKKEYVNKYDSNNNRIEIICNSETIFAYKYNEHNHYIEEQIYDSPLYIYEYTYNDDGSYVRTRYEGSKENSFSKEITIYDEFGNIIKTTEYYSDNGISELKLGNITEYKYETITVKVRPTRQ